MQRYIPPRNLQGIDVFIRYLQHRRDLLCKKGTRAAERVGCCFYFIFFLTCIRNYMWTLNAVYSKTAVFSIMLHLP